MTSRGFLRFAVVMLFVSLFPVNRGMCQGNGNEEQGSKPFDSSSGGGLDTVSLTNGGLTLNIPLVSVPQRGALDLSFFVTSSTKQWFVKTTTSCGSNPRCTPLWTKFSWASVAGQVGARVTSSVDWRLQNISLNNGDGTFTSNIFAVAPDGTSHLMGGSNTSDILYPAYSLDATGLKIAADQKTLILPNGTNLYFPGTVKDSSGMQAMTITDANGNQIQINTAGSNIGWLDTLNRWFPGSVVGTTQPGVPTSDLSTCPSGTVSAKVFSVPSLNGGTRTFKFCYSNVTLQTAFDAPGSTSPTEYGPVTQAMLSAVVLPDLTMWTLSYDNYGSVTRLGLPTGGSISYGYITRGQPCNNCSQTTTSRWVASRTVDANDGTGGHTWKYTYTNTGVTVTDPQGNDTVHTISSPVANAVGLYETQTQFYQGSAVSGTLLKTKATQFSGAASTFTNIDGGLLAVNVVPTQTTLTLPGGQVSKVVDTYDSGAFTEPDGSPVVAGSLLQEDQYDFSGAVARSIVNRYLWQDNASYKTANLLSLPSSSTVKNGVGNQVAQTTYAYDQVAVASSGVATSLVAPPAGANLRGNMNTVSRYLNTTNGFLSSLGVYFDTGMPASATDSNGNTTSFGYSATYAGAYQTQTSSPDTNGIHHVISGTYDFNTGLLTGFTDQNGQPFGYQYDNMLRLTQSNHPDGGQTTLIYPNATTVERQRKIDAARSDDSFSYFDGLGRAIRSQVQTPSGSVYSDTQYDTLGRVATVSNPYFSNSDPTYGITQAQYDPLGRITRATKSDGSFSTAQYTDNCTTVSDDSGHVRKMCTDAFGRLVEVDEPSVAPTGASASGSVSVNGSLQSVVVGGTNSTAGTGSVTINPSTGGDRSTQVVSKQAAPATLTITLQNQDGTNQKGTRTCENVGHGIICTWSYTPVADTGNMWFQVSSGGAIIATSAQVPYGTSATTLAQNLGNSAGANSAASWSYAGGSSFKIAAAPGAAGNGYIVTAFVQSKCVNSTGTNTSMTCGAQGWSFSPASGSPSGGVDAVYQTVFDSGTVTITANGHNDQVSFGQNDTANTIASNLAGAINTDTAASVNATVSGNVVNLNARFTGAGSNVPLTSSNTYDTADFSSANFTTTNSGSTLTGGADTGGGTTTYDAGTISLSVGGYIASVPYGQSSNSTSTQVAAALATALSDPNSPVSATASGSGISLTYRAAGVGGDVAVTSQSSTSQGQYFSSPSFTSPGTTLAGGTEPQGTLTNAYQTLYSYDTLGNLLNVNQKGDGSQAARVRSFTYDSLLRLLTAANPESGTVTYSYDNNGNLHSKTDARNLTITYAYDQLNRLTSETYSNGVNSPSYFYDSVSFYSATNAIGRLVHASNMANAASTFSYDAMGRVIFEGNWTPSNPSVTGNPVSISYNLLGARTSLTYPSGRQVTFSYNTGDQLDQVQFAQMNGVAVGYNYLLVADTNFHPTSTPKSLTFGNGIVESLSLNQRLQLSEDAVALPGVATLADHAYNYNLGANNGNIVNVYDKLDSTRTQNFAYEALNRLAGAGESRWGVSFAYDAWGNRLQQNVTAGTGFTNVVTVDANNHIQGAPAGCTAATAYCYDAAGNLLNDSVHQYNFDIEGRINSVDNNNAVYTFDGVGHRVRKDVSGQPSIEYIYLGSHAIAEKDISSGNWSDYIFAGGRRIAKADCNASGCAPVNRTTYYHSDQVNSSRLLTDGNGNPVWQGTFLPFGEEYNPQATTNHYKFSDKERDSESNLDYFGARNYSSTLGRFASADWSAVPVPVPYANLGNPQTLNLYSYVGNNPIGRVDADGHGYAMFDTPNPGSGGLPMGTSRLHGGFGTAEGNGIFSSIISQPMFGHIVALCNANGQVINNVATAFRSGTSQLGGPGTSETPVVTAEITIEVTTTPYQIEIPTPPIEQEPLGADCFGIGTDYLRAQNEANFPNWRRGWEAIFTLGILGTSRGPIVSVGRGLATHQLFKDDHAQHEAIYLEFAAAWDGGGCQLWGWDGWEGPPFTGHSETHFGPLPPQWSVNDLTTVHPPWLH